MMRRRLLILFIFLAIFCLGNPRFASADVIYGSTKDIIQSQIDANNKEIEALRAEIAEFQQQLDVIGVKKSTLQSTINSLAISQKQLAAQIKITQSKIASANLEIQRLTSSIGDKEESIATSVGAIGKELRTIAGLEEYPLIAKFLSSKSLGDAWQVTDQAVQFNQALQEHIADLRAVRTALSTDRDATTKAKENLLALQKNLALQKRSVDAGKIQQQKLLAETKNKESTYQQQLAQKRAAEKASEEELLSLQSQLDLVVHANLLPKVGSGILFWPFSSSYMAGCSARKKVFGNSFCITQYFGNTSFATANPQVYNGKGHGGIDISVPVGTPILAARGGTVLATGNTDLAHDARGNQCYSYGKWVMIVHTNGLNTLYAHLSSIDVSKGQSVATGQVIGLSGMTGYSTGPHLHFATYATEGTKIMTLNQFRGATGACAGATMPVATLPAYLNPLSYL